jgi:uncharacterized protein YggE
VQRLFAYSRILAFAYSICLLPIASYAEPAPRQISVTGQAEQSFTPDKADIYVAVVGQGKALAEAKQNHDTLLNALHQVTAQFKIGKSNVKTLSDSINPQYDYVSEPNGSGRQVLRGYEANHRLQITLEDTAKTADFINALVSKNIDRIEQVQYGLKDSEEAEMQVTLAAVKNAKKKAGRIIAALDSDLGKVLSVNADGGGYQPQPMPMMAMGAPAMENKSQDAAPIPAGDVKINKNVTVQFEIQ